MLFALITMLLIALVPTQWNVTPLSGPFFYRVFVPFTTGFSYYVGDIFNSGLFAYHAKGGAVATYSSSQSLARAAASVVSKALATVPYTAGGTHSGYVATASVALIGVVLATQLKSRVSKPGVPRGWRGPVTPINDDNSHVHTGGVLLVRGRNRRDRRIFSLLPWSRWTAVHVVLRSPPASLLKRFSSKEQEEEEGGEASPCVVGGVRCRREW